MVDRLRNVGLLTLLVAAAEQNYDDVTVLSKVHTIARSKIYFELANSVELLVIAEVSSLHLVELPYYPRPNSFVPKSVL